MTKSSRFSEQDTIADSHLSEPVSPPMTTASPVLRQEGEIKDGSVISPSSTSNERRSKGYSFVENLSNEKISHYEHSDLPEAVSPATRPGARRDHDATKEAYTDSPIAVSRLAKHQSVATEGHDSYKESIPNEEAQKKRRRICGLPMLWFIILCIVLGIIIILAIVLGAVLGTRKSKPKSTPAPIDPTIVGGGIDPAYYSKQGVFNGSGIAVTSVNFGIDPSLFVFYQSYTGQIEQRINQANGDWSFVTTVATNARNATPLSAVAYIVDSVATWHLFYIDTNDNLKQRTSTNASNFQTNIWSDGPINNLNLKVFGDPNQLVGMQACYWGNYYGSDGDFNRGFNVSKSQPTTGMNLWYASNANTFEQYVWTNGDSQWNHSQTWNNYNAHAGVGCQSWESGSTMYLMLVNTSNTLEVFWKDTDLNKTSTPQHPIDSWTQTSVSVPNMHPSTSLGYTDWLAYQAPDTTLHGVNITWAAENTTITPPPNGGSSSLSTWSMMSSDAGISGTHFAITGLNLASGGRSISLFYQHQGEGDGIRLGRRDSYEGDFSFNDVPIPASGA